MPRYKLVIFDFDGTLADSFGWFLDTFDSIADRFDFKRLDRSNIDALRRMDARELMQLHGVPLWKVPMIAAYARKRQSEDLYKIKIFGGFSIAWNIKISCRNKNRRGHRPGAAVAG